MKTKYISPFLDKVILTALGVLTLSCAFIGKISEKTETLPNTNTPITSTDVSQNPSDDNQARFVIRVFDSQYLIKYGYIDQRGKIVIPPQFGNAGNFHEGLAAVQDLQTGLWGYIDLSGKYIIEPKYQGLTIFSEGLAFVRLPGSENLLCIDQDGKKVFELLHVVTIEGHTLGQMATPGYYEFHDGLALIDVVISEDPVNSEPNYVDRQGNYLFPNGSIRYLSASSFSNGFAIVGFEGSGDEVTIIDTEGKVVSNLNCPEGFFCSVGSTGYQPFSEGVSIAYGGDTISGRLNGYFDTNGDFAIMPQFLVARPFNEGLAAVMGVQTELWGFIDHSGDLVIPYQFSDMFGVGSVFSEGLAPVRKPDGQCGFIDKTGAVVLNFCIWSYKEFFVDVNTIGFHDGLAYVTDGAKTGYIDKQGNFVYIDEPYPDEP